MVTPISRIHASRAASPSFANCSSDLPSGEIPHTFAAKRANLFCPYGMMSL